MVVDGLKLGDSADQMVHATGYNRPADIALPKVAQVVISKNAAYEVNPLPTELIYLHLPPDSPFPQLSCLRTRVVVVIDLEVSREWQWQASKWIVEIGCQYMMAWGIDCTSWDDSVDYAHLEKYDYHYEQIPMDDVVVTTWHDDVPLAEVFRYAKGELAHPNFELNRIIILDITKVNRSDDITEEFSRA